MARDAFDDRFHILGALFEDVDVHGEEDDHALDHILPEGVDAQEVHAVGEGAHDEHADHGAADGALAAQHGGAAQDGGGDGLHLLAVTGSRLAGEHPGRQHHPADARQHAGIAVGEKQDAPVIDAGKARRLPVAAHGIDVPPHPGAVEQIHREDDDDNRVDHLDGHPPDEQRAQVVKFRVHGADRGAGGVDVGKAAGHLHHGQGDDEGGQRRGGDDEAVEHAAQEPH